MSMIGCAVRRIGVVVAAIVCVGCHSPLPPHRAMFAAIIHGRITTDGNSRPGLILEYEVYENTCGSGNKLPGGGGLRYGTDADGRFSFQAFSLSDATPPCLRILVRERGTDTARLAVDSPDVPFMLFTEQVSLDSVRVDINMPRN